MEAAAVYEQALAHRKGRRKEIVNRHKMSRQNGVMDFDFWGTDTWARSGGQVYTGRTESVDLLGTARERPDAGSESRPELSLCFGMVARAPTGAAKRAGLFAGRSSF